MEKLLPLSEIHPVKPHVGDMEGLFVAKVHKLEKYDGGAGGCKEETGSGCSRS